jgi:hypothetical protein
VSPRVLGRRPVAIGLAGVAVLASLGLSGCAEFDKALGQQEAEVYFQQTTSVAFKLKVRAACNGLPNVKAEPIPTGVPIQSAIDVVVYNTTGASDADIARLEVCVNKFSPQVVGVDFEDASDDS